MVKKEDFADTPWKRQVECSHVRLDVVVMRTPGVHLPHYANRLDVARDGTGLLRLRPMAVISELKVTATQGKGQIHRAVARDAYKLSMLLDELERLTLELAPRRSPPLHLGQPPLQGLQPGHHSELTLKGSPPILA